MSAIAPAVCAVPIEDHLLVGECSSGDLRLFNPTAALIWRCVEDGVDAGAIARTLADAFRVPYAQAEADVEGMLRAWETAGLMLPNGAELPAHADSADPSGAVPPGSVTVRRGAYRLNKKNFEIDYRAAPDIDADGRVFIERTIALLSGLADPDKRNAVDPVASIEFCVGRSIVSVASKSSHWSSATRIDGLGRLCWAVLRTAYDSFEWLFTLHGAGMAWNGTALVLPAATGSGKSTLAAYLASRGWSYMADDIVPIEPAGFRVLPMPTAVGLKAGSLAVLEDAYPGLRELQEFAYGEKSARYLALASRHVSHSPSGFSALVFPRYAPNNEKSQKKLSAAEAAARLMQAGIGFGGPVSPAKLTWFAALVGRTPCYSLDYTSLAEAETALRSIALRSGAG